jgi:hypothetical protein
MFYMNLFNPEDRFMRRLLASGLLGLAAACSSVPLTSLPKLAAISPFSLDPAAMEVAVRIPEDFRLPAESVVLDFQVTREGSSEQIDEVFVLDPVPGPLTAGLDKKARKGTRIYRYRIAPADHARMTAFRETLVKLKAEPGRKKLEMKANAKPCLVSGANPFQKAKVSVFLRTSPDEDFFTLLDDAGVPVVDQQGVPNRCAKA